MNIGMEIVNPKREVVIIIFLFLVTMQGVLFLTGDSNILLLHPWNINTIHSKVSATVNKINILEN